MTAYRTYVNLHQTPEERRGKYLVLRTAGFDYELARRFRDWPQKQLFAVISNKQRMDLLTQLVTIIHLIALSKVKKRMIKNPARWYKGEKLCVVYSSISPMRTVKIKWPNGTFDIVPIRLCHRKPLPSKYSRT